MGRNFVDFFFSLNFEIRSFIFAIHMSLNWLPDMSSAYFFNSKYLFLWFFMCFVRNFWIYVLYLQHVWRKQNKFRGPPPLSLGCIEIRVWSLVRLSFLATIRADLILVMHCFILFFIFSNSSTAFILFESGNILHVGIYSPPSEFIILCPCSIDFHNSSTIFHQHTKLRSVLAA